MMWDSDETSGSNQTQQLTSQLLCMNLISAWDNV
jgi:hypothetical protein